MRSFDGLHIKGFVHRLHHYLGANEGTTFDCRYANQMAIIILTKVGGIFGNTTVVASGALNEVWLRLHFNK